jgi:NADH dehydrogenase FAD-containing subunit
VTVTTAGGPQTLCYDRLVYALGSQLLRPPIAGLAEHAFDVDTYHSAAKLYAHLQSLPGRPASAGQLTVVVVGAGLTGIETVVHSMSCFCSKTPYEHHLCSMRYKAAIASEHYLDITTIN